MLLKIIGNTIILLTITVISCSPGAPITTGITVTHMFHSYVTPWEFFTSALVDGLSLEFEWQQISSSLQDYSQYSGRSQ